MHGTRESPGKSRSGGDWKHYPGVRHFMPGVGNSIAIAQETAEFPPIRRYETPRNRRRITGQNPPCVSDLRSAAEWGQPTIDVVASKCSESSMRTTSR